MFGYLGYLLWLSGWLPRSVAIRECLAIMAVADACYLESMKSKTLWYFVPKGASQLVTVSMKTVVHPNLSCYIARSMHHIPHTLCDRNEAISAMTRKPILMTQEDRDMIMDEIERRDRIDYEQYIDSEEDSSDDE